MDFAEKFGGKSFIEFANGLGSGAQDAFVTGQGGDGGKRKLRHCQHGTI